MTELEKAEKTAYFLSQRLTIHTHAMTTALIEGRDLMWMMEESSRCWKEWGFEEKHKQFTDEAYPPR